MKINLHTHTIRCNHATGTEEEYIKKAIEAGLKELGFSDHTPYFFPGTHYSTFRMYPQELKGYVSTLQQLRQKYAGQLTIHIGLEVEYYPDLFPKLLPFLLDHGIEYMLLGQHYVGNEVGCHYSGRPTEDPDVLRAYCRQVIEGMHTGLFTYLAHPDLIYFTADPQLYRTQMQELCRQAKQCNIPLEYNLLGIREQRNYPNSEFWNIAAEFDCPVVLGVDAHSPQVLAYPEAEQQARNHLQVLGLQIVENPKIRRL